VYFKDEVIVKVRAYLDSAMVGRLFAENPTAADASTSEYMSVTMGSNVQYLALDLSSLACHNRFQWFNDASEARRFPSAADAEAVKRMTPGATGVLQVGDRWFVVRETEEQFARRSAPRSSGYAAEPR